MKSPQKQGVVHVRRLKSRWCKTTFYARHPFRSLLTHEKRTCNASPFLFCTNCLDERPISRCRQRHRAGGIAWGGHRTRTPECSRCVPSNSNRNSVVTSSITGQQSSFLIYKKLTTMLRSSQPRRPCPPTRRLCRPRNRPARLGLEKKILLRSTNDGGSARVRSSKCTNPILLPHGHPIYTVFPSFSGVRHRNDKTVILFKEDFI